MFFYETILLYIFFVFIFNSNLILQIYDLIKKNDVRERKREENFNNYIFFASICVFVNMIKSIFICSFFYFFFFFLSFLFFHFSFFISLFFIGLNIKLLNFKVT